jgi:lipopolysaccharide export system permease LptF/LptG-like protein
MAFVQCFVMTRILDRYIIKELGPPFAIGVGVFTFFLVIDRIYQLTDLVITKSVPFALVFPLLIYMLPALVSPSRWRCWCPCCWSAGAWRATWRSPR